MKNSLRWADVIFFGIACMVGALVGSIEYLKIWASGKYFYAMCLSILFCIIRFILEVGAIRRLSVEVRGIWIAGNPLLKIAIFRFLLLGFGGWFVVNRFVLEDRTTFITFALLMALFVGAFFETFRFLRGGKWR